MNPHDPQIENYSSTDTSNSCLYHRWMKS